MSNHFSRRSLLAQWLTGLLGLFAWKLEPTSFIVVDHQFTHATTWTYTYDDAYITSLLAPGPCTTFEYDCDGNRLQIT